MAKLTWFRSIFTYSDYTYRLLEAGFPILIHISECGILNADMWHLASQKGKVNRIRMEKITIISKNETHVKVASGTHKQAETLMRRLDELHTIFGTKTAIAGWVVGKETNEDKRVSPSPLVNIWTSLNSRDYLVNPDSKV